MIKFSDNKITIDEDEGYNKFYLSKNGRLIFAVQTSNKLLRAILAVINWVF